MADDFVSGVYKDPGRLSRLSGRISSRKEGNTMSVGKNVTWKQREKGSNTILTLEFKKIVLRLLGRISSVEKGKNTEMLGRKSIFLHSSVLLCRMEVRCPALAPE